VKTHLAPIELVHPDAAPRGTAVVGDGIPDWLLPVDARTDGDADVVLVAAEAARAEQDTRAVAERLSDGGIVVAVGPNHARETLAATLGERGIANPEHLTARRRRRGRSVELSVGMRSAPAASALRSETVEATVLRRDERARLGGWLPGAERLFEVRTSWRGSGDTAVVSRVDGRGSPTIYAKLGLGEAASDVGAREAAALTALGGLATGAGARVPQVQGQTEVAGRPVVLLSVLAGRPVARRARRTMRAAGHQTAEWLRRFAAGTQARTPAASVIDAAVLQPASVVVRGFEGGTAYVERLQHLAEATGDGSIPVTAAHGDLTLWNVLEGRLPGILDWAGASVSALPLVDLPYLLVDTRYWRSLRRDRVRAFRQCFADDGMTIQEQAIGFAVPAPVRELAFHACWLGHAANEHARGSAGPFTEIVRTIALRASA
jgi:hypothetical protein